MKNTYFLTLFLPRLRLNENPEMSLNDVLFYLRLNLSPRDMKSVDALHRIYDIENMLCYLVGTPMNAIGSLTQESIRGKIEEEEFEIPGVATFFSTFTTPEERKANAGKLVRFFLDEHPHDHSPFVASYFHFEHTVRHLTAFLRARKLGQEYTVDPEELGFDIEKTEEWPQLYKPLQTIWETPDIFARDIEDAILKWKFDAIESLGGDEFSFSIDTILAYLIRIRLVEAFQELQNPVHLNNLQRIARAVR